MSSNLRRRLDKLVKEEDAGTPCPECGFVDGKTDEPVEVVVAWRNSEDPPEPEEFCGTCGTQLSYTIDWQGEGTSYEPL